MKSLIDGAKLPDPYVRGLLEEVRERNLLTEIESRLALAPPLEPLKKQKKRAMRKWQPTERERAILSLPKPGIMSMEEYCRAMDEKSVFPEKWRRGGKPVTHCEAWDSKNERLRNVLECERRNVWNRMKKTK